MAQSFCVYCGKKHYANGMCRPCYTRYRNNGFIEHKHHKIGKEIGDFTIIEINREDFSNVQYTLKCNKCGYLYVVNEIKYTSCKMCKKINKYDDTNAPDDVKEMIKLYKEGYTYQQIADIYLVSHQLIQQKLKKWKVR